jgi:hypothetical protein
MIYIQTTEYYPAPKPNVLSRQESTRRKLEMYIAKEENFLK